MTHALATTNGTTHGAPTLMEPNNFDDLFRYAQILHKGGLLPTHFKSPEAVLTAVVMGRDLGLTTMQSIRSIYIVEGKPTLSADAMSAVVQKSSLCQFFRLVETDDTQATYETQRKGSPKPVSMSFTIKQAALANLTTKFNWKAYPAAMLRARCISSLCRAVYPDVLMGVYDPEELERTADESRREPRYTTTSVIVLPNEAEEAHAKALDELREALKSAAKANKITVKKASDYLLAWVGDTFAVSKVELVDEDGLQWLTDELTARPEKLVPKLEPVITGKTLLAEASWAVLADEPPGARDETLAMIAKREYKAEAVDELTDGQARILAENLRRPDYLDMQLAAVREELKTVARSYLWAAANEAGKTCEMTSGEVDTALHALVKARHGFTSINELNDAQMRVIADELRANHKAIIPVEDDIPPFDPAA